jgi:NAD-dependent SIR2 family protein deacetylase
MFKSTTHMHGNIYNDSNILNSQKHESNQSRTTTSIIQDWEEPIQVTNFDVDARDYGSGIKSHEFNDTPITLQKKVHVLAQLIRQSKCPIAYTGAGISTAAGIDDYATKAKEESVTAAGRKVIKDWKLARPTLTHRVLVSMFNHGHLSHWIQQNHDSLPQKAGYPQHALNEIHGSLHDPANPIVPYEGTLRDDLYEWMHEWQEKTDLCLSLGTSMSGFNCDSVPQRCAERINGLVIINLQQTSYDVRPIDNMIYVEIFDNIVYLYSFFLFFFFSLFSF